MLGHYPIDGYEFSDLSDTIVNLRSGHYKTIVEREEEAVKSRDKAVLDKMNAKRKARVQHFLNKKKAKTTASSASVKVDLTASDGESKSEGFTRNVTFAAEVQPARKSPREPATLIRFKPGGEYCLIEVLLCCLQFVSSLSFRQVFPNSEA